MRISNWNAGLGRLAGGFLFAPALSVGWIALLIAGLRGGFGKFDFRLWIVFVMLPIAASWFFRSAIRTVLWGELDDEGVRVRRLFGVHRAAWGDVADLRPYADQSRGRVYSMLAITLRDGRRWELQADGAEVQAMRRISHAAALLDAATAAPATAHRG